MHGWDIYKEYAEEESGSTLYASRLKESVNGGENRAAVVQKQSYNCRLCSVATLERREAACTGAEYGRFTPLFQPSKRVAKAAKTRFEVRLNG